MEESRRGEYTEWDVEFLLFSCLPCPCGGLFLFGNGIEHLKSLEGEFSNLD